MDDSKREDVFLNNAALGTDLVTSYVAATDDEPPKRAGASPCCWLSSSWSSCWPCDHRRAQPVVAALTAVPSTPAATGL